MQDDPEQDRADLIERFVNELRELRDEVEVPPTWDAMVHRAKIGGVRVGKSTLHKIAKLDVLPSELAVRGYVTGLGMSATDVERWVARRTRLAELPAGWSTNDDSGQREAMLTPTLSGRPGWRWWLAAAAALLVTNVVTGLVVDRVSPPKPAQNTVQATTGDNPLDTPCLGNAEIAASSTKSRQFLLEIVFSAKCRAFWARITRSDDRALHNRVEVSVYRRSDPHGSTRQDAVEPDVQSAFTTLIVRNDPTDRICAIGAILTDDTRTDAVEPICI